CLFSFGLVERGRVLYQALTSGRRMRDRGDPSFVSRPMRILAVVAATLIGTAGADAQTTPPAGRGAISGHVTDQWGDPVIGARVAAEVRMGPDASRVVSVAETDDRGEYRISRLPE